MIQVMPAGLEVLTREAFGAWTIGLESILDGNVSEGEIHLSKTGRMPPLP